MTEQSPAEQALRADVEEALAAVAAELPDATDDERALRAAELLAESYRDDDAMARAVARTLIEWRVRVYREGT